MYVSTCKTKQHDSCWLFGCLGMKWFILWTIVLKKCSETGSWIQIKSVHLLKTMQLYVNIETWVEPPRKNQWLSSLSCDRLCSSMVRVYWLSWYEWFVHTSSLFLISLQMASRYFWSCCFDLTNRLSLHRKCAHAQRLLWDNLNPLSCCDYCFMAQVCKKKKTSYLFHAW